MAETTPETPAGPGAGRQERPVGWWLKEADRQLDAAFDRALEGHGSTRRAWQVLASLARQPQDRSLLVELLAPFGPSEATSTVIGELEGRRLVEEDGGLLHLTAEGVRLHAALSGPVEDVRRQVAASLPGEDYVTLVRLLGRLAAGLRPPDGGAGA